MNPDPKYDSDPKQDSNATEPKKISNSNQEVIGEGFQDPRFRILKVLPGKKEPGEKGWTISRNYAFNDPIMDEWVRTGGNYGIFCPNGDCCFVDADIKEIQDVLDKDLSTFWYSTGREGHRQYIYGIEDPPIRNIPLLDGAYIKGQNGYALGPGSIHPNGTIYGLGKSELPIRAVSKAQLLEVLKPFLVRKKEMGDGHRPIINSGGSQWISLTALIDPSKFRKSGNSYQGPHPIHGSETGLNLSIDMEKNVWHCFRHDSGGSVLEWIAVQEGIISCADAVPGALRGEKFWETVEVANRKFGLNPEIVAKLLKGGARHDTT